MLTLRVIWAALLTGQIMFLGVALFLVKQQSRPAAVEPSVTSLIFYVGCAILVGGLLGGHVIRGAITSKASTPRGTTATAYAAGTIILLALLEAPAMIGGVVILLSQTAMPGAVLAGLAIVATLVHFPLATNVDDSA